MVPGHSVPGYFGPWSFWLGTFQSQVYWFLGHFSPVSCKEHFGPRAFAKDISVPGHFGFQFISILGHLAKVVLGQCHFSPWSLQPCDFGPWVISVLVHFGNFICRSFLPGFISILVISAPGHFCSCHFGPELFWPPGHFSHGSFQQQVISILCHLAGSFQSKVISAMEILVPGHFASWSFRSLGHFGVVTFWSQVILTQGHFGPPGTFLSSVILVSGHSVPSHFCSRAFCPETFWVWVWVISVPGHFSSESFPSLVISALGHFSPWKFLPGWFNFANLAIYRVKHNVLLLLTQLIFKFCSGLQQQMSFTCHFE